MPDINLLDGSPISDDLNAELIQALSQQIPGPFADDAAAITAGVAVGGIYDQLGVVARVQP